MRFSIIDGKPYLISEGMAYPISIYNGAVTVSGDATKTDADGTLTLLEVMAKCGNVCSSIVEKPKAETKPKAKRKTTE